jgi:ferredoxin-NADP reductase
VPVPQDDRVVASRREDTADTVTLELTEPAQPVPAFAPRQFAMLTPNAGAQVGLLRATGMSEADVSRAFRTFNSGAPAFIELSQVARPHKRRSE